LINLVENALKYSPPTGLVQLAWECCGDAVLVHVLDQGPGVPEEDRARLLERFQRGRNTGDVPGSGIGLAVVDTLMQAMGGRVEIGAAPGGGADFRLLLPMAPEPELSEPARSAPRAVPGAPS
jgi:signal transduction histidine kinase